jgi:NADPH:quinone reductase-like Zn-dependent oxidoreductase
MKVIINHKYGAPDRIEIKDVDRPVPGIREVLVKVHATSVNYNTLMFVTGSPFVGRFFVGLAKPKIRTPGNDLAGIVEEIGSDVSMFKPGDAVYGDLAEHGFGTLAEYACAPEHALSPKPANLSFEQAAAVPEAGLVALQALRDSGRISAGNKVLINGASGGIGSFAVQIAKYFGAEVTGVCSGRNAELVLSLGADHVIDYTLEDFSQNREAYDLILGTAGYRSLSDYKRALKPGGRYVSTGGTMKQVFQAMLLGPLVSTRNKKLMSMVVKPNKDLDLLTELIESGKVRPVIDRQFALSETAEALRYYGEGRTRGKVVISITNND